MDTYRKSLIILKSLFNQSGNSHWVKWIEKDIYEWDFRKSTSHHRSAFGGMGSINDQPISTFSAEGCWLDTLFDYVKKISWTYADSRKIKVLEPPPATLEGILCNDCGYKEITAIEIERFLSKKHLPSLINIYLKKDDFEVLLKVSQLMQTKEVEKDRLELKQSFNENKIIVINRKDRSNACPDCNSSKYMVTTWNVSCNQPLELITRKVWWKRWFELLKG